MSKLFHFERTYPHLGDEHDDFKLRWLLAPLNIDVGVPCGSIVLPLHHLKETHADHKPVDLLFQMTMTGRSIRPEPTLWIRPWEPVQQLKPFAFTIK